MIVGYPRRSTDQQSVSGQVEMLKAAGAQRVFSENASGIVTERRALARAIAALQAADVLGVTKLDRLGRSLKDILNTLQTITDKGAGSKRGQPCARYQQCLRSAVAECAWRAGQFERELIIARTSEGRIRAKANGIRFGRKAKLTAHQMTEANALRAEGKTLDAEVPVHVVAARIGDDPATLLRWYAKRTKKADTSAARYPWGAPSRSILGTLCELVAANLGPRAPAFRLCSFPQSH